MDIVNEVAADLQKNLGGHALLGLGFQVAIFAATFVMFLVIGISVVPGIVMNDDAVLFGGYAVGIVLGIALIASVSIPVQVGLYRAMWRYLRDGEPLTFGSVFANAFEDLAPVVVLDLLIGALVLMGLPFCYVGGLAVALALQLAFPAAIVHRLGPIDAIGLSFRHVRANLGWNAAYWGVGLVVGMIMANVPLSGIVLLPALASFQLRCYRAAFGDGEQPVEA